MSEIKGGLGPVNRGLGGEGGKEKPWRSSENNAASG
jgi:hypothetical protein